MAKEPKAHGNLFNIKEKKKDTFPDARGTVNITPEFIEFLNNAPRDGYGNVVVDVAGWTKVGPRAGKYLSITLSEHRETPRDNSAPQKPQQGSDSTEWEDEIPF